MAKLKMVIIFHIHVRITVLQLRYMAELLGINIPLAVCGTQAVMIPRFLGRLIGDKLGLETQKDLCLKHMTTTFLHPILT